MHMIKRLLTNNQPVLELLKNNWGGLTIGGQRRESIARYDQQRVEKFTGGLNPPTSPAIPTLQSTMTTLNLGRPTEQLLWIGVCIGLAFKRMRGRGAVPAAKLVVVGTSYRRPYDVGSRRLGQTS